MDSEIVVFVVKDGKCEPCEKLLAGLEERGVRVREVDVKELLEAPKDERDYELWTDALAEISLAAAPVIFVGGRLTSVSEFWRGVQ